MAFTVWLFHPCCHNLRPYWFSIRFSVWRILPTSTRHWRQQSQPYPPSETGKGKMRQWSAYMMSRICIPGRISDASLYSHPVHQTEFRKFGRTTFSHNPRHRAEATGIPFILLGRPRCSVGTFIRSCSFIFNGRFLLKKCSVVQWSMGRAGHVHRHSFAKFLSYHCYMLLLLPLLKGVPFTLVGMVSLSRWDQIIIYWG